MWGCLLFYILSQLTTFYNSFFAFSLQLRSSWKASSTQISTRSDFRTFPEVQSFFTDFHTIPHISVQRCFPLWYPYISIKFYRSVEMCGNSVEMYGNIVPILFGNSTEFCRKDFRTVLRNSTEISWPDWSWMTFEGHI